MRMMNKDEEIVFLKEKIIDALLNAARLRKLGFYVDDNGMQVRPCHSDAERTAVGYDQEAERRTNDLLRTLTLTDDECERRNSGG